MSINLPLKIDNLFCTPVYSLLMPTYLNQLNKISDRYIEEAGIEPFRSVHFNVQCFKPNEENV